jgi:hypothetical protein
MQNNKKPINESDDPRLGRIDPKNSLFRDAVNKINSKQARTEQAKSPISNQTHKKS